MLRLKAKATLKANVKSTPKKIEWEAQTLDYSRLTAFDLQVKEIVDEFQVTHSTVLRIVLRTNRYKVNQSLQRLWMSGFIHRDIHGLVISTFSTANNPELKAFIENSFKVHLT